MKIYWGRFSSWQIRLTSDSLIAFTLCFFLIRQIWKPNWAIGSTKKVMENISSQTKATWISRPMLGLYQKLWRHLVFIKMGKFYINFPTFGLGKFGSLSQFEMIHFQYCKIQGKFLHWNITRMAFGRTDFSRTSNYDQRWNITEW